MNDLVYENIEIAPIEEVKHAAGEFAAALAETPQFKVFDQAAERFRKDQAAQQAMGAYQEKQIAWSALIMLNALSAEQRAELESLQNAFVNQPIVQDYFGVQTELATLCHTLGDTLSESIGLNYAAACGVSCCG
ncbi:MAG: YlbF family regulator [Anaerolineales bacterium]